MTYRKLNDFEVINRIKQGDDEAFQLLVNQYKYLIAKKIRQFNLAYDYDDCFQEALILLHKSVMVFDDGYNKTFTRYYELNLTRYLISYKKKNNHYFDFINYKLPKYANQIYEEPRKYQYLDDEIRRALRELSAFEKEVYQTKIINHHSVRQTAKILKTNEKRIYNALDRIKKKIKTHLMQ
jgi:RNA polymerase sporulation-specific sigma factor